MITCCSVPDSAHHGGVQDVHVHGVAQTLHVLITTYSESADMVRECILRLLVAPEPIYMEKDIYVCDDGHALRQGPLKRDMVEQLRILGMLRKTCIKQKQSPVRVVRE